MRLLLSIDDTDNEGTPGSGQLLEQCMARLQSERIVLHHSSISRHQLYVDDRIAYTSHNSAMCCLVDLEDRNKDLLRERMVSFLCDESAPGSDPGLCIAVDTPDLLSDPLIQYGLKAKQQVLSKEEAYSLAGMLGLHLSEHGGDGSGVVGALAAIGLKLYGSDGRCRGWKQVAPKGTVLTAGDLCSKAGVPCLVGARGQAIQPEELVFLAEEKLKTVLVNHEEVLVVRNHDTAGQAAWATLSKAEIKQY
jgi:hypothetical protein